MPQIPSPAHACPSIRMLRRSRCASHASARNPPRPSCRTMPTRQQLRGADAECRESDSRPSKGPPKSPCRNRPHATSRHRRRPYGPNRSGKRRPRLCRHWSHRKESALLPHRACRDPRSGTVSHHVPQRPPPTPPHIRPTCGGPRGTRAPAPREAPRPRNTRYYVIRSSSSHSVPLPYIAYISIAYAACIRKLPRAFLAPTADRFRRQP